MVRPRAEQLEEKIQGGGGHGHAGTDAGGATSFFFAWMPAGRRRRPPARSTSSARRLSCHRRPHRSGRRLRRVERSGGPVRVKRRVMSMSTVDTRGQGMPCPGSGRAPDPGPSLRYPVRRTSLRRPSTAPAAARRLQSSSSTAVSLSLLAKHKEEEEEEEERKKITLLPDDSPISLRLDIGPARRRARSSGGGATGEERRRTREVEDTSRDGPTREKENPSVSRCSPIYPSIWTLDRLGCIQQLGRANQSHVSPATLGPQKLLKGKQTR